jgi:hypothetical protein
VTAEEFVKQLNLIKPTLAMLIAKDAELIAEEILNSYTVTKRSTPLKIDAAVSPFFQDIFSNYDLTKLSVSVANFMATPVYIDNRWFFGYDEGDRLFIDPLIGEVFIEELKATETEPALYLSWARAKSFDHFMSALLITMEYFAKYTANAPIELRLEWAIRELKAAGGKKYTMYLGSGIDRKLLEAGL